MASELPSSCRNWLLGNPSTVKPRPLYVLCSSSSFSYCGVRPQREATLTMSLTLSAYWASEVDSPSMVTSGMSLRVTLRYNASNHETSPDNDPQAEQPSMIVLEAGYGIVAALALTAARVLPWRRRDLRDDTQQWSPAGEPYLPTSRRTPTPDAGGWAGAEVMRCETRRPYDLRHAAVSTWSDAGVSPTTAGHPCVQFALPARTTTSSPSSQDRAVLLRSRVSSQHRISPSLTARRCPVLGSQVGAGHREENQVQRGDQDGGQEETPRRRVTVGAGCGLADHQHHSDEASPTPWAKLPSWTEQDDRRHGQQDRCGGQRSGLGAEPVWQSADPGGEGTSPVWKHVGQMSGNAEQRTGGLGADRRPP